MTRPLIAANWKMHTTQTEAVTLAKAVVASAVDAPEDVAELAVFPPFVWISDVVDAVKGSAVAVGAQDCAAWAKGAYTGDVSPHMLADAGCRYVILGHSERRQHHGETDQRVAEKVAVAIAAGLTPILCVGETDAERKAGKATEVVKKQLAQLPPAQKIVVAYEPVWAIGSGKQPTTQEIAEMHGMIHKVVRTSDPQTQLRVLYGGSVKPDNAAEILRIPGVNGVLVGGASLDATAFTQIAQAAHQV